METPNMAAITASLERSLQNCSLNYHCHSSNCNSSSSSSTSGGGGGGATAAQGFDSLPNISLELNSEASLPFHWEQCLDLKTGEIYYINWRTGMKSMEDPRVSGGEYYSEDDSSSNDSEESSSEQWNGNNIQQNFYFPENDDNDHNNNSFINDESHNNLSNVLVVGGCKSCLMYYMVPKQLEICPKCCGQLLHFDRSECGSSS